MNELQLTNAIIGTLGLVFCGWVFHLLFSCWRKGVWHDFRQAYDKTDIFVYVTIIFVGPALFSFLTFVYLYLLWSAWI